MSEQLKTDFARAQKFIKAGQHAQAIAILKPHNDHPRIAALIADLETKQKSSSGGKLGIVLWILLVITVGVIAGGVGYVYGGLNTRMEYEIPVIMEAEFVRLCTESADLEVSECSDLIQHQWLYYQAEVIECYGLIDDGNVTEGQFLQCIADVGE